MALVMSNVKRCERVPQGCRNNSIFVVNSEYIKDPEDMKSDLNGTYQHCLEIKTLTVNISKSSLNNFLVRAKHRTKVALKSQHIYLKVHRVRNKHGLIRNISYFHNENDEVYMQSIVLQYIIDGDIDQLKYTVEPHGNRKESFSPFHPIKKSTINSIKGDSRLGKRGSNAIYVESMSDKSGDFGDYPRSKKQIADIGYTTPGKFKSTEIYEVESLLAFNEELEENAIIWHHSDLPSDMWVIGTQRMVSNLKDYTGLPISVDPTFNHGQYEVTPFTYRHPLIQAKSKHNGGCVNAVMMGPTIIHHQKTEDLYDSAFRVVAHQTKLKESKIGIVTDGEQALINAIKGNFIHAVDLRCTNHFRQNCKDFLLKKGISEIDHHHFLELIFSKNGLIEAENKRHLRTKLNNLKHILTDMGETGQQFFTYLKEREKPTIRKLIRDHRRDGGMPEWQSVPERVYTNQSESCNSMLAAHKKSMGFTKKDDVSKKIFVKDIWMGLVRTQDIEIEKALYGQSDRFRLIKEAKHLEVDIEKWYNMSEKERNWYFEDFNGMSLNDVKAGKIIELRYSAVGMERPKHSLSVSLTVALPFVFHAKLLQEKAEDLLNSSTAISQAPTPYLHENETEYLVAGHNNTHSVSLKRELIVCKCKSFRFLNICSHSVAIAESHGLLQKLIDRVKVKKRNALTYPTNPRGAGRKGNQFRQKRSYTVSSATHQTCFTKIWHNNEPFNLINIDKIPTEKSHCQQCNIEFPRGILCIKPFDVALSHAERWEYLNRNRKSEDEPKYMPSPAGKTTTKYYCIKRDCIFNRFPYFTPSLLNISNDVTLRESHFKLLANELNFMPC